MSIPCRINPLGFSVGLPAGYTRVEYLEGTGTQYIDTLFYLPPNVEAEAVLSITSDGGYLFGNYGSEVSAYLLFGPTTDLASYWAVDGRYSTGLDYRGPLQYREFFHLRIGRGQALLNEQPLVRGVYSDVIIDKSPRPLALFARNHKNGNVTQFSYCCIRNFVLRADGKVLRNYQPALDPTGAPCMFDLVSKKAFHNLGTGDFLYPTESTTYALRRVLPDWGKLTENGLRRLYHAPANYTGELYDYAIENGYKPIIEPEKPETGYWVPRWTETEEEIVLEWVETEPPMEESLSQPQQNDETLTAAAGDEQIS